MPHPKLQLMTRALDMNIRVYSCILACLTLGFISAGTLWASDINSSIQQAQQQLNIAIQEAEISLQSHQPGSGHTKQHMQQVINVLEGPNGEHFNAKSGNTGDGDGVIRILESTGDHLKSGEGSSDLQQALEQTLMWIHEAIHHATQSVQGKGVMETHKQAGLAVGLLLAAAGQPNSESPITGGLSYAAKRWAGSERVGKTGSR